jgi:hypothetical protein
VIANQKNIRPFLDRLPKFEFQWNFLLVEIRDERSRLVIDGREGGKIDYIVWVGLAAIRWESAMSHQYKAGDVVTVFQISPSQELVIEGKATIRKRVAEVDEQYRVEFANKPGVTYERFVDSWGQDDPEKYVQDFNRRSAR